MKINPVTAIVILVIIFIVAGFACLMIPPGGYDNCRLKTFITVFAGLSLLLTVMFYYAVIQLQIIQGELLTLKETQNVQEGITVVVENINKGTEIVPDFCAQLLPLEVKEDVYITNTESDVSFVGDKRGRLKRITTEYKISDCIFAAWQTAVLEYKFVKEQEDFYTCLFLQWATSSTLRKYWRSGKISLTPQTQRFGDLLFAYAPKKNIHCPDTYVKACAELKNTKEYACLFPA